MPTKYPSQIDNNQTLPEAIDNRTPIKASTINNLRDAIIKIESELGITPRSTYGTVSARLDYLEGVLNTSQTIQLAGDLGGTATMPKVIGIQGNPISSTTPTLNQILAWNGLVWSPTTLLSILNLDGDLSGSLSSQTVVGIQNIPVDSTTPTDSQILKYVDGYSKWIPSILNTNDLSPPLSIEITSSKYVEVNSSVTPSFTFSYNFTPIEVTYSDSEGNTTTSINSPFTSYVSPYTYTKTSYGDSVIITIEATDGIDTISQTFTIVWTQKVYYGLNASTTLSESFIESLSNSLLYYDFSEISEFAINISSGYWHFAIRTVHDELFFSVNKIFGGFTKVGIVSVTNANGFSENYTLYRTDNPSLGNCFIEIQTSDYSYL